MAAYIIVATAAAVVVVVVRARTHTVEVSWFSCKHYRFISASGQQQFLFNFYFSFFMTLST